jgi:hypothetical protein
MLATQAAIASMLGEKMVRVLLYLEVRGESCEA